MGKDIFFIISFLALLLGMIFIYKVPEKISLFRNGIICFITELCFGAVIVKIYSIAGIPVGLISLGIAYFIIGIGVWGIIIYQKKIQKLKILIDDFYSILIITIWFFFIFLRVFSTSILNVYGNIDPAVHYSLALKVLDTGEVSSMYFAEVYNGIILELFEPFCVRLSLYKVFILADSFANLLNVFMFFILTTTFVKSEFVKTLVPYLGFLYFAGWPFFSYVIGGFVYFGWGVTLVAYVVYLLIQLYTSVDRRNKAVLLGLVLIGSFSVLVCYMLFIVILAGIVILSLTCIARKNGLIPPKKYIAGIGLVISLIAIMVFMICFKGYFHGDLSSLFRALKTGGGISKAFYQDFVFLMPAVFYMGWKYIKNKEISILYISISVTMLYICCTFIMCLCDIMSPYYYYKSYYLLWMFAWIINIAAIEYFWVKDKAIFLSYGGALLFAILITMSGADSKLAEKRIVIDELEGRLYPSPFPIWDRMELFLTEDNHPEDKDALVEVCGYINNVLSGQKEIPMVVPDNYFLGKWYTSFTGYNYRWIGTGEELAEAVQDYQDAGCRYIVVFQNTDGFQKNRELLINYEIVYDNGYYGIYDVSTVNE